MASRLRSIALEHLTGERHSTEHAMVHSASCGYCTCIIEQKQVSDHSVHRQPFPRLAVLQHGSDASFVV
jgi:hypothetical protein